MQSSEQESSPPNFGLQNDILYLFPKNQWWEVSLVILSGDVIAPGDEFGCQLGSLGHASNVKPCVNKVGMYFQIMRANHHLPLLLSQIPPGFHIIGFHKCKITQWQLKFIQ